MLTGIVCMVKEKVFVIYKTRELVFLCYNILKQRRERIMIYVLGIVVISLIMVYLVVRKIIIFNVSIAIIYGNQTFSRS